MRKIVSPEHRRAAARNAVAAKMCSGRSASVAFAQNTGGNLLMESVASGLTGDSSYLGAAQRNSNEALGAINATYEQLSEIATAYGARVPRSVIE